MIDIVELLAFSSRQLRQIMYLPYPFHMLYSDSFSRGSRPRSGALIFSMYTFRCVSYRPRLKAFVMIQAEIMLALNCSRRICRPSEVQRHLLGEMLSCVFAKKTQTIYNIIQTPLFSM